MNSAFSLAEQLLLPLGDLCPEFFDADAGDRDHRKRPKREDAAFRMTVLKEYIKAGEGYGAGKDAYLAACAEHEREPSKNPSSSANKIITLPESQRMLTHLRKRGAAEAELELAEFYRMMRLTSQASLGLVPLRKTVVVPVTIVQGEDEDDVKERARMDMEVFEPNLSVAKGCAELMGKALGVFSERIDLGLSHDDALELLDED